MTDGLDTNCRSLESEAAIFLPTGPKTMPSKLKFCCLDVRIGHFFFQLFCGVACTWLNVPEPIIFRANDLFSHKTCFDTAARINCCRFLLTDLEQSWRQMIANDPDWHLAIASAAFIIIKTVNFTSFFFKKWANPGLFFCLFSSFQHVTI